MAAGPGVSMQNCSPARELSISVQQGGNQTHGDRVKTEEVTGKNVTLVVFLFVLPITVTLRFWLPVANGKLAHYVAIVASFCACFRGVKCFLL